MRRLHKGFEGLNFEEKKKFVETLLIAGSIVGALRFIPYMIPFFILFIVVSLVMLIWISMLEQMNSDERLLNSTKIRNTLFSAVLAFSFSSIITVTSIQGISVVDSNNNINYASLSLIIGSVLAIYLMAGFFIFLVLVRYKNATANYDVDVVD
jgi:hypothetical protein